LSYTSVMLAPVLAESKKNVFDVFDCRSIISGGGSHEMAKKPGRKPLAQETTKASFLLPTPLLTSFKGWCTETGTTISKVMRHWMEQAVNGRPPYSLPDGAPGTGDAAEGGIPDVDAKDRLQLLENTKAIEEMRAGQEKIRTRQEALAQGQSGLVAAISDLKTLVLSAMNGRAPKAPDPDEPKIVYDEDT